MEEHAVGGVLAGRLALHHVGVLQHTFEPGVRRHEAQHLAALAHSRLLLAAMLPHSVRRHIDALSRGLVGSIHLPRRSVQRVPQPLVVRNALRWKVFPRVLATFSDQRMATHVVWVGDEREAERKLAEQVPQPPLHVATIGARQHALQTTLSVVVDELYDLTDCSVLRVSTWLQPRAQQDLEQRVTRGVADVSPPASLAIVFLFHRDGRRPQRV